MNDPRQRDPVGSQPPRGGPGGRPPSSARVWLILIVALIIFDLFFYASIMPTNRSGQQPQVTIPYTTFVDQVRHNNVANAAISSSSASGDFKKPYVQNGTSYPRYTTTLPPVGDPNLLPLLLSHGVKVTGVTPTTPAWQGRGGLPARPQEVPAPGRAHPQGGAAGRSARHRQDPAGAGRGRGGARALLQHQ